MAAIEDLQKSISNSILLQNHIKLISHGVPPTVLKEAYLIHVIQSVIQEKKIDRLFQDLHYNEQDDARMKILLNKVTELCSDYISETLEAHT